VNADADLAVLLDCSGSLHEAAVGGGNGGELALGLGVAPLLVGVEALGELPIGCLDLVDRSRLGELEQRQTFRR